MTDPSFALSVADTARLRAHMASSEKPLLRRRRKSDVFDIVAYGGGPEYQLGLTDDDEEIASLETWGQMADHFGFTVEELRGVLTARGFEVPDVTEDLEPWESPEPDAESKESIADPYAITELLEDLRPRVSIPELIEDYEGELWFADGESIGQVWIAEGSRPGDSTRYVTVDSPAVLGALQLLLDQDDRRCHIRVE